MHRSRRLVVASLLLASLFSISALASPGLTTQSQTTYRYVLDFPVAHPDRAHALVDWLKQKGFDIAGINRGKHQIEVITGDAGLKAIADHGLHGRVIDKRFPGQLFAQSIDERYLNPERLIAKLESINKAYPNLTRLVELGKSLEGRPILGLLISTTPGASDPQAYEKPSLIIDGMHHAREIMTTEIVVDVAEQLLAHATEGDEAAQRTLSDWNVWLIPMLNIDGNNIVWTSNNWWRKNARATDGSVHGVDINRNYPFRWASCGGSSDSSSADDYHGASAGSEPETQALVGLADAIVPTASLSYHSYSELVLYAMGCNGEVSAENEMIDRLGHELAAKLPSDNGSGNYTPGTPWQVLYSVDGDSMDYLYGAHGTLAYTFEVNQEFQPSYDLREPTLVKHRVAWGYFMEQISQNLLAVKVIDLKSGQPTPAEISINTITHQRGELPFHTNAAGNYFKVLDPGHYVVSAKLSDGRTGSLEVDMKGQPNHVSLTVQ